MVAYMCIYIYICPVYIKKSDRARERERESKSWLAFRSDSQTETAEEQLHGAASIGQLVEHALRKRAVVVSVPTGGFFKCGLHFLMCCLLEHGTLPLATLKQAVDVPQWSVCPRCWGVDLRSTAGNRAWVRSPQLTFPALPIRGATRGAAKKNQGRHAKLCR